MPNLSIQNSLRELLSLQADVNALLDTLAPAVSKPVPDYDGDLESQIREFQLLKTVLQVIDVYHP